MKRLAQAAIAVAIATAATGCYGPPEARRAILDAAPDAADAAPDAPPVQADAAPPRRADAAPDAAGRLPIGAACRGTTGCAPGLTCDHDLPGSMCTRACRSDGDCPSGGRCRDRLCRPACNPLAFVNPCRFNYACAADAAGKGACMPHCAVQGCPKDRRCDKPTGICVSRIGGVLASRCAPGGGGCSGMVNGFCLDLGAFSKPFCTVGCSPLTRRCPNEYSADCALHTKSGSYCVFLCDPARVPTRCPFGMKCALNTAIRSHMCVYAR